MPRAFWVEMVPAVGFVNTLLPSALVVLNQKFASELEVENFLSLLGRAGSPLMTQNCEPLPGPTPAKSSEVAIVNGCPVWNCETDEIAQPPSSLPEVTERLRKNGNS